MQCHLKRSHFRSAIGLLQQHEDNQLHMEHSQQQMLFDDVLEPDTGGRDALEVPKWLLGLGMQQGVPNITTQAACLITKYLGDQQFRDATEVSTSMIITLEHHHHDVSIFYLVCNWDYHHLFLTCDLKLQFSFCCQLPELCSLQLYRLHNVVEHGSSLRTTHLQSCKPCPCAL